jgi:hypothetical protein
MLTVGGVAAQADANHHNPSPSKVGTLRARNCPMSFDSPSKAAPIEGTWLGFSIVVTTIPKNKIDAVQLS